MLNRRLIDGLYTETMVLADEARSYFDGQQMARGAMTPMQRVIFSCESLKVTTRLMHVIAWLLTQRALAAGEIDTIFANAIERRLGNPVISEAESLATLPREARALAEASIELYRRIERLEQGQAGQSINSPAHALLSRIEQAF
jgi:regulator of CtrA degradation